jgi:hypothetical protein
MNLRCPRRIRQEWSGSLDNGSLKESEDFMQGTRLLTVAACLALGIGCRKAEPFKPQQPLSVGTLLIHFTAKVEGPVELLLDDVRIPVANSKKKVHNLVVRGLAPGRHRYFISSPRDAFGPAHGEVELPQDRGTFLVNFSQHYNAVLYGKTEPAPPAQGLPGVSARMEP